MNIVHAGQMPWGESLVPHRQGTIAHKRIFEGKPGSPDNYSLTLAQENPDYVSPRHRHNWDQVRFSLQGSIPIGKALSVDGGEVAYFPEGVRYGPQVGGTVRLVLLLQFGGASGQGYMSPEQTREGREQLLQQGVFEAGIFKRQQGAGPLNQDAYEAIWQQVFKAPVHYPEALYKAPIVMRAPQFPWRASPAHDGVSHKALGYFPGRGLTLEFIRIEAGHSTALSPVDELRLLFVVHGQGRLGEPVAENYSAHTALRLAPHEALSLHCTTATELFLITVALLSP